MTSKFDTGYRPCPQSPTGQHCYHYDNISDTYLLKSPKCCHCGQSQRSEHGPFYPGDYTRPWAMCG